MVTWALQINKRLVNLEAFASYGPRYSSQDARRDFKVYSTSMAQRQVALEGGLKSLDRRVVHLESQDNPPKWLTDRVDRMEMKLDRIEALLTSMKREGVMFRIQKGSGSYALESQRESYSKESGG